MTSVIVWLDLEYDNESFEQPFIWPRDIWLAADSRISGTSAQHRSGYRTLTDYAPKILPIQYTFYRNNEDAPGVRLAYSGEIGFAYAGNTLPANLTYSMICASFIRMTAECGSVLPSLDDMVKFITRVGGYYARETQSCFELFVTGTCPRDQHSGVQVFHLSLWSKSQPSYHKLILDSDHRMYMIGNRKQELRVTCGAGFANDISYSPAEALAALIAETAIDEVGGLLSIARVERLGGITLFPKYVTAVLARLGYPMFNGERFGSVGEFKVGA